MKKILLLGFSILLLPALAFSITIDQIDTFDVHKSQLGGMVVTVNYLGGGSDQGIWEYKGGVSGAQGSGWSLELTADYTGEFNKDWLLSVGSQGQAIDSFTINAYGDITTGAHNFFDIALFDNGTYLDETDDNHYTPGSHHGIWYPGTGTDFYDGTLPPDNGDVLSVTKNASNEVIEVSGTSTTGSGLVYDFIFSDPVNLTGQPIYGDLFAMLEINFSDPDGLGAGQQFAFGVDTDVEFSSPVPEPSTLLLFGLGLLGFGAFGRKKA